MNKVIFGFGLVWCSASHGQQVICSSGTQLVEATVGSITYTIGEPVFATVSSASNVLTQGFEQPWADISTSVAVAPEEDPGITVFPNPTRHILHVVFTGTRTGDRYDLMDAAGRLLQSGPLNARDNLLDMTPFAAGQYLLRVSGIDAHTFRIHTTR